MPFDALFLSALTAELTPQLLGARIDKIQMPVRDQVVLQFHGRGFSGRLLLSASPGSPRLHLTNAPLQNPAQPPMFCMLLRKHLSGGRIAAVTQPPLERLVDLTLDCVDELGAPRLVPTGRAAQLCRGKRFSLSITHTASTATAFVVAWEEE